MKSVDHDERHLGQDRFGDLIIESGDFTLDAVRKMFAVLPSRQDLEADRDTRAMRRSSEST